MVATNPRQIKLGTPKQLVGTGIANGHPALQPGYKSKFWINMLDSLLGLHGPADLVLQIGNEPVLE
jgi:hypothetical protein